MSKVRASLLFKYDPDHCYPCVCEVTVDGPLGVIRVLGSTWDEARENARCEVARYAARLPIPDNEPFEISREEAQRTLDELRNAMIANL